MSLTRAEKEMISQHGSDFSRICETHPSIHFRKRKARRRGKEKELVKGTRQRVRTKEQWTRNEREGEKGVKQETEERGSEEKKE